jgi:hypothetical protein
MAAKVESQRKIGSCLFCNLFYDIGSIQIV